MTDGAAWSVCPDSRGWHHPTIVGPAYDTGRWRIHPITSFDRQRLHSERLAVLASMTRFGVTPTRELVDLVARIILNLERTP